MRVIGGEIELKRFLNKIIYTDSGRSSLKLLLQTRSIKKVLLPDYLCEVIIEILKNENIEFDFYHINEDLSFDIESIKSKEFDALYIINYFGIQHEKIKGMEEDKIIIEDNVFFFDFENDMNYENWFAFNSYRKITSLADGSLIKTNLKVTERNSKISYFSTLKYKAKFLKYDYIYNKKGKEENYLRLFNKAEKIVGKKIAYISNESIYLLSKLNYDNIMRIRKKRFNKLYSTFEPFCLNKKVNEYSFFVLKVENRDNIRKKLFKHKIFLPVHWPKVTENILYDKVLSVPLFENYSDEEFEYMFNILKGYVL